MTRPTHRPDLVDIDIDSLDASGDGLGSHRGQTVAVPFTLPGERVRVQPVARSATGLRAILVEVLRASPHRIVPRCPHFGPCGGCAWQHIAYAEQLRLKTEIVQRLIARVVPGAPAVLPTLAARSDDPWGYRQKVHFVFGSAPASDRSPRRSVGAALVMGHYERGSRRVVPVRECPVHDERGNALAFELHQRCVRAGIAPANGLAGSPAAGRPTPGVLKSIVARAGHATGETLTTIVVSRPTDRRLRAVTRGLLESGPPLTSLHLNVHPRGDAFIFGPETRRIGGPERLREEIDGTSFLISPTAFFQTNVQAAAILVRLVVAAMPRGATVLDLYAGAGLFALPLARAGFDVTAVEENRSAVADGEASRRLNGIPRDRCRFVARRVEVALGSLRRADAVVLDPPRDGCAASVIEGVFGRMRPGMAAYVSCNPEALARDLAHITALGYRIDSLQPVDMFPHTAHIETVVNLHAERR